MGFPDPPFLITPPGEWLPVLEALGQEQGITILLGATDTGKSTLAKYLIDQLCRRKIKTALVDADIGQSSLGPPTTVGLNVFESPPRWDGLPTPEFFFVGSNTPEENIPLHLKGVKRMVVRALSSGAEMILVDTTGLVQGDLGKELKRRKIDLLSPRFIIALQREGELEHILESYSGHSMVKIFRLSPSEEVRSRSREERRSYRMRKFQEYFKGSEERVLVTNQVSLEGTVTTSEGLPIPLERVLSAKGLLVGLKDSHENTLALGLVQSYQEDAGRVHVLTPLSGSEVVARLQLSPLRLLPTFEDERVRPGLPRASASHFSHSVVDCQPISWRQWFWNEEEPMKKPLWTPREDRIRNANMTRFIGFVNERHRMKLRSYGELYAWSVEKIPDFWAAMWDFAEIKASRRYDQVVDDLKKFPGAKWFPGARLNFAENLLRFRDDRLAFIFKGETAKSAQMTYRELHQAVARLATSLREIGIVPGDRVAGYMPNLMETAIAMLAATSLGAVWSSCATDIGAQAALDRLGQIEPKVLFTVDGYFYKGKSFSTLRNAAEVAKAIPSLKKVAVIPYIGQEPDLRDIPHGVHYEDFLARGKEPSLQFEQLPFDHPVYIMFSSGTTGKPKCMVQGSGGILINHLKELILHTDLKREDKIFYITTCSWMMWNWLLGSLGAGATIVLYDGNPSYPDPGAMWKLTQDEKITIFGLSASYVNYLRSEGIRPGKTYDLSSLREISQTGSPLSPEGFEYVYREIKEDLHFNSISGGTDINGCFAIGSPVLPVYPGELQSPGLAMKVKAYDENGRPIWDRQGELVCEAPAPSMPLYFWNDPTGERYRGAYFEHFPNVWRHGDYIVMHSDTGGITFYGRSDAVLKPSGVRIGTAEIYNVVEKLEGVADSLAIGQNWEGDQRIILFVKLAPGAQLTEALKDKIRKTLRDKASPRHVPAFIMEMPDAPYTLNMKKVESAVTNIIHGRPVLNRDALVNPQVLDYFEKITPELKKK